MSEQTIEEEMSGTKPVENHAWLQNLVGSWRTESEMIMGPDQPVMTSKGTETVVDFGGLWAIGEGEATMPNGEPMRIRNGLGYDVSFNEYRGFWLASVSSHLWKYVGTLSDDCKTMTLECEGPDMINDGKTAMYRDVIELIDDNHRTLTSYGQDPNGNWQQFMKAHYYRI